MAIRWAVANGNSNAGATWNGGTVPGPDDDVFTDGFTVTINANWTVLSLNNTQRPGGTVGGQFNTATNGLIVNAQTINAGSISCFRLPGMSNLLVTFNVSVINASLTNGSAFGLDQQNSLATLVVNSDTINGGGASNAIGVRFTLGGGTVNCRRAIGGSAAGASAIASNTTAPVVVNGDVEGGTNATAYGLANTSTGSVTLNGIAIASDIAEAINNASTGTFTIAGFRFASNGKSPWTGNGKIFFNPLSTVNGDVVNSSGTLRTLGRVGG